MRVDHRRLHISVPEQLLHGSDVVAGHQQMGGERVAERMTCHSFGDPRSTGRFRHRSLNQRVVDVVTTLLSGVARVAR